MLNADFPAETANKRPSLVDILSGPAPRSPVRAARFDASPHIILTWAYLRLLKFLLSEAKRLFQQYRSKAEVARSSWDVRFSPESGYETDIVRCPLSAKPRHRGLALEMEKPAVAALMFSLMACLF